MLPDVAIEQPDKTHRERSAVSPDRPQQLSCDTAKPSIVFYPGTWTTPAIGDCTHVIRTSWSPSHGALESTQSDFGPDAKVAGERLVMPPIER